MPARRERQMRSTVFEFRGGDFSNSSHGPVKGSGRLQKCVWIMLVSTRRSRAVEKGREDLLLSLPWEKCIVLFALKLRYPRTPILTAKPPCPNYDTLLLCSVSNVTVTISFQFSTNQKATLFGKINYKNYKDYGSKRYKKINAPYRVQVSNQRFFFIFNVVKV